MKENNTIYFKEIKRRGNHAGTKARNVVEEILKESGCVAVNSRRLVLESNVRDEKIIFNISLGLILSSYNTDLNQSGNVHYFGSFVPGEIPGKLKGKYGLVWDGNRIDGYSGLWREYTKYNNLHKLSLNILAGLPVIVWSWLAIAKFAKENHIGIIVDNLYNMSQVMLQISDIEYKSMCSCV